MKIEIEYAKHDYMHMKLQGRVFGTSRNLEVMVKLHMVPVDIIEILKVNFKPL